jgi:outer membrane protein assembly factor BamB
MFQGHEHNEEIWNENGITQVNVNNLYGSIVRPGWYRIVKVHDGVMTIYNKRPGEAPIVSRAVIDMTPERDSHTVEITRAPEPETTTGTYRFEAQIHNDDLTPAYIATPISDDGVYWNGIDGFYQFSLKTARRGESLLKVRINRNSNLLAVALQAQRGNGTWGTVAWTPKSHDDNCGDQCVPIDNQFWIDLKFRIPRKTSGPFRLVSGAPSAPEISDVVPPEINAFHMWLTDRHGSLLDEIDVGNPQSEAEHSVSVAREIGRSSLTSIYPTGVRYWLDITYLGGGRKSMVSAGNHVWTASFDAASQKPGRHTVKVQVFDDTGRAYSDFAEFTIAGGSFEILAALPTGGGIQSSPAVAGGKVYVGSNDGKVYAFDPASRTELWTFQTGDQVISSPTVVNGVVYIGSADSKLYALNAFSGNEIWEFATRGPIFGAPEVVDGVVYVGSGDHTLYAVDAAAGIEKWRFSLPEDPAAPNALIQMKPTYHDGVVYFGAWDVSVYAVKATDGTLLWNTKIPRPFYFAPAYQSPRIVANKVLVSAPTGVHYLLDKTTGAFIGNPFPSPSSFGYNDLWVEGTSFYSISFGGTFAKFDLSGSTPTEQWRTLTGFQSVNSGLVLFDSQLLVGGFKDGGPAAIHGNLIAINPATRAVASHSIAPEGWIFSRVGVGDGFAYLGALDGNLYVMGPSSVIP